MKVLIIRHADPDYEKDSLTDKGWREAELLADRLGRLDVKAAYVSPLGRAKDTASLTLERLGMTAAEMPWLREFEALITRPDLAEEDIVWDWLPADWTAVPDFYERDGWMRHDVMRRGRSEHGDVRAEYEWVTGGFDRLLAHHGYERDGGVYRAVRPNRDTILLFCHFGLECVLLSHVLGVSPMVLWHGLCAAPSSVTTINTEERREGIASLRIASLGDISHLYASGEEPAFSARFCECFDSDERHD